MKRELTLRDPRPWPEGCIPTPEQWASWYPQLRFEDRVEIAERVLDAQERASSCFIRDHDHLERMLEDLALLDRERRSVVRYEAVLDQERARGLLHVWEAAARACVELGLPIS